MKRQLKTKTCRHCKTEYCPATSTQVVCSPNCAVEYTRARVERKRQADQRKHLRSVRQIQRKRKESLKTRNDHLKLAQAAFNRYIRLRDRGKPCISCLRSETEVEESGRWKTGGAWDAGHFLTIGAHPELRFIETNVHRQCKSCNAGESRNSRKRKTVSEGYRDNLVRRIGITQVTWLEGPHPPAKWSIDEIKQIRDTYRRKARELEEKS